MKYLLRLFNLVGLFTFYMVCAPSVAYANQNEVHDSVVLYSWVGPQRDIESYQYNDHFVPKSIWKHASSQQEAMPPADLKHSTPSYTANFAVNEPAIWHIVIATPTWFTSGTQVPTLDLPNLVTTRRNITSTNLSNEMNGTTWTYEFWNIPLFITAPGEYDIPPMSVIAHVSVDGISKEVKLTTKAESILVDYPTAALSESRDWFAAPNASLTEDWSVSEKQLHVGDSITRTVTLTADDSLAVMLPNPMNTVFSDQYQSYISPSQHQDTPDSARRVEKTVYIMQKGGEVSFPELKIQWWDTKTQSLKTLRLPAKVFTIKHTLKSWLAFYCWYLVAALLSFILILLAYTWMKRYYQDHPIPNWFTFGRAVWSKNWPLCRVLLYKRLYTSSGVISFSEYRQDKTWSTRIKQLFSSNVTRYCVLWLWFNTKIVKLNDKQYQKIPALNHIRFE